MASAAKILRYVAFGLMLLFAVVGGAFILAETLTDPGGTIAVLLSASWAVPMIALAVYALRRPAAATRLLTVVAAVAATFVVLDAVFRIVPRDEIGPVGSITVFAVAVALGFLGLRRPAPAGWLLLLVGAANLGGGASGVAVAVPALVIGGLFLLAAAWAAGPDRGSRAARHDPPTVEPEVGETGSPAPEGALARGPRGDSDG